MTFGIYHAFASHYFGISEISLDGWVDTGILRFGPAPQSTKEPAKTIARGMPGRFRCDRGDHARVLLSILHARPRAHCAPGIPCALLGGQELAGKNSRETRGEIAKPCRLLFEI
jgi:hypothetical protein